MIEMLFRLRVMSDETNTDFPSSADRAVDSLHRIDEKVNRLREDRLNDPDSLGDKLIKSQSQRWQAWLPAKHSR